MSIVTYADNVLDPTTWETIHDVVNINAENVKRYGSRFPSTGRIYLGHVAENCDITPHNEMEIDRLEELEGHFFVMVYPEGLELIAIIVAIVLAAVSIGLAFLLRNSAKPDTSASPNNALADRQNSSRPNERIPEIVGKVRAVPDLIAVPYRVFIGNQEVEYDYMCIGKGSYTVSKALELTGSVTGPVAYDVKEDQTFVEQIDGNSVEIYGPNTSPNSGDAPQLTIGTPIGEPIKNIMKSSSVIGQILRAPNDQYVGGVNIRAVFGGLVETSDSNVDFTDYFAIGDNIFFNANDMHDPGGIQPDVSLTGTYPCLAVSTNQLTLQLSNSGVAINPNWASLANYTGEATTYTTPTLTASGERTVGPFILDVTDMTEVWANFVAPNGLFKVSGSSGVQYAVTDIITMTVQALDENYVPVGSPVSSSCEVVGSAITQSQRATTLKFVLPLRTDGSPAGRVAVSAIRTSDYDPTWQGTNSDQIQWRDLYAISPILVTEFGDVTTVQTKSYATPSALTAASRKFNLEVTRNIPVRTYTSPTRPDQTVLLPSKNAADIISFLALDPYCGDRTADQIDYDGIYGTLGNSITLTSPGQPNIVTPQGELQQYFGTDLCTEFCYTFDDTQTSFEEMMADIGQATFCQPYRIGSVMGMFFEKLTDVSTLLFNHKNKLPGSETRTVTFGLTSDYDGIELDYIDPNAPNYPQLETTVTLYFPTDQSATNPRKIKTVGIRNNVQATILGWRLYQQLLFQNTATEFRSTAEASIAINKQRILVADNTRPDTQDGEIEEQDGLALITSQPVTFTAGRDYVIFLQHYDGTVESIPITEGPNNGDNAEQGQVILSKAPIVPLVLDPNMFAKTTYQIAGPENLTFRSSAIELAYGAAYGGSAALTCDIEFGDVNVGDTVELINVVAVDAAGIKPPVNVSGSYVITNIPGAIGSEHQLWFTTDWSFLLDYEFTISTGLSGRIRINRPQYTPATPFLLTSKKADDNVLFNIQAINYDDRYYLHDTDFIDGVLSYNQGVGGSSFGFAAPTGGY